MASCGLGAGHVSQALVFGADPLLAVNSFQSPNREVPVGDRLEVIREGEVHGRAAHGADEGQGLRHHLLADHDAVSGREVGDEAHEGRGRLVGDAADSPVTRAFGSRNQPAFGIALSYTFGGKR